MARAMVECETVAMAMVLEKCLPCTMKPYAFAQRNFQIIVMVMVMVMGHDGDDEDVCKYRDDSMEFH